MAERQAQTGSNTTAIIFAVFAVACIVAFLAYRGSDVGQLPNLVGNLGGGRLVGPGIFDTAIGFVCAVLIGQCWFGLGSAVLNAFPTMWINQMRHTIATAVGLGIWSFVWFFLGLIGLYSMAAAIAMLLIGLPLAIYAHYKLPSIIEKAGSDNFSNKEFAIIAATLLPLGLVIITALAPPTAKDTLLYHFALPKAFIAQHSNAFIDGNVASYLAMGTEVQYVWAMLLGNILSPRAGEAAAGAIGFLFLAGLLRGIYHWAREIGITRLTSMLVMLTIASIPTVYYVASSEYIDLSLAWFVTLAIYSLTRWWKEQTWSWAILIAIFLGAALSVKLTAVFVFAAFALIVLLRARSINNPVTPGSDPMSVATNSGRVVLSGFAVLILAIVIALPWYVRTWAATGSPVFPFYMSIWPGKANGWDVERSNLFHGMNSQYGGADVNKLNYLTAPARVSIMAQPEQPANYDGVLGVAFLIGLPLLIWALWKFDLPVEVKISVGVTAIIYLFWLFSSEQLRYLLPIVPVLAIAIAASGEKIGGVVSKVARCALIAASVCGLLTSLAWFCKKAPLRVALGGESRDQYLTRNLDYYPYYQAVNSDTPEDAKVWLINMRRDTYNLERPVFSDYLFEDWTLRKMVWESRSVQELRSKTAGMGIKYVLTRHDFLFDYDKSSLVDDKKPRAENEAKLKIAKDFILDPAYTIRADNKFSLIKVF